ncbi:P-loop containing nucleoside triphosphate hydrolase protein [Dactylonectria macrodidyma]|uniref:P-loop containing nucleoside triphosphate hydrolase protein n=1 Tax=Dactylonectria macrodidyma TaxID=307937 RepID=A0A9P9ESH7_9HYPO|nr:P-loop containing nucleoside triphosphate hydrolase protein [Dactylonectria macrodidyma]
MVLGTFGTDISMIHQHFFRRIISIVCFFFRISFIMRVSINDALLQELSTADAKALHDNVDRLSACGVGKLVNLPQIIVVGLQSAGKSSVLEAITRVRFPVDAGVCTRFATELVLRTAKETRIDVSVKFANNSKSPQTFQRTGFSDDDLPDIIKEAKEAMGISDRDFSKDVLRLEIEGPKMYPLTLVDLPGLYSQETEDQSQEGKETVEQLVDSYMVQENCIILAVIAADMGLESQAALTRVNTYDTKGERTIGIITKPDLTKPGHKLEQKYIRLAKNNELANKLKHGWHVLRNRAEDEPGLEGRDAAEEAFFRFGAWKDIPSKDRGVASLRKKLSGVLYTHIQNSLPGVMENIERQLKERSEEKARLGNPRISTGEMRSFLLGIASEFQRLARDGMYGRYSDAFFGDVEDEDHKLRAQIRNFNRAFDHILSTKGSTKTILKSASEVLTLTDIPFYLQRFLDQYPSNFFNPVTITREDLDLELQQQASSNRGLELPGLPHMHLVIQLFQKQAAPWKLIAEHHIRQVLIVTKAFVDELFAFLIGPPDQNKTTEAILRTCVDEFYNEKETLLQQKLTELIRPYSEGFAFPLDADFHNNACKTSMDRLATRVADTLGESHPELFDSTSKQTLSRDMITTAVSNSNDLKDGEFGTTKIIDMMETYYEMSRRTFTENVINLAIEACLICDIPNILTPTQVGIMSDERLRELAEESQDIQSRRTHLEEEIGILGHGLNQCILCKPRGITGMKSSLTRGMAYY